MTEPVDEEAVELLIRRVIEKHKAKPPGLQASLVMIAYRSCGFETHRKPQERTEPAEHDFRFLAGVAGGHRG